MYRNYLLALCHQYLGVNIFRLLRFIVGSRIEDSIDYEGIFSGIKQAMFTQDTNMTTSTEKERGRSSTLITFFHSAAADR